MKEYSEFDGMNAPFNRSDLMTPEQVEEMKMNMGLVEQEKYDAHNEVVQDTCRLFGMPIGKLSDGYHTFDELYEHRIALFKALCKMAAQTVDPSYNGAYSFSDRDDSIWYSEMHNDGSVMEGWFIAGLTMPDGKQITYHIPNTEMETWPGVRVLRAPKWDGHTSADVLNRLEAL